jgi:hypothetical protein
MNVRVHSRDFSFEDYQDVVNIRQTWDFDFILEVKDNSAEFGTSERHVYYSSVSSIEIRP